ncbi:hypothetical protein J6590_091679 [Homalodisca vitripennis]|nr:hypothetical protein J6590_091679 [Homalodisca vitripennis]
MLRKINSALQIVLLPIYPNTDPVLIVWLNLQYHNLYIEYHNLRRRRLLWIYVTRDKLQLCSDLSAVHSDLLITRVLLSHLPPQRYSLTRQSPACQGKTTLCRCGAWCSKCSVTFYVKRRGDTNLLKTGSYIIGVKLKRKKLEKNSQLQRRCADYSIETTLFVSGRILTTELINQNKKIKDPCIKVPRNWRTRLSIVAPSLRAHHIAGDENSLALFIIGGLRVPSGSLSTAAL